MFGNCKSLEYLNIYNFLDYNSIKNNLFFQVPQNLIYCLNNEEHSTLILEQLKDKKCSTNDCSLNWKSKKQYYIEDKNICIKNCDIDDTFKYQYKDKCLLVCPEGFHPSEKNECIKDSIICPQNYPFEIILNNECTGQCSALDLFNKNCLIKFSSFQVYKKIITIIINNIKHGLMNSILSKIKNNAVNN